MTLPEKTKENAGNRNAQLQTLIVLRQIGQSRDDHIRYGQCKKIVHSGYGAPFAIHILNGQNEARVGH